MVNNKLIIWDSSDDKQDVLDALTRITGQYKKSELTQNEHGVWILSIDKESHDNLWEGK